VDKERQKEESTNKSLRAENKELKFKLGQLESDKKRDQEEMSLLRQKLEEYDRERSDLESNNNTNTTKLLKEKKELEVFHDQR
jgi:chromosome segregation ATPase